MRCGSAMLCADISLRHGTPVHAQTPEALKPPVKLSDFPWLLPASPFKEMQSGLEMPGLSPTREAFGIAEF